ncbi:hypothetical protein BU23DRAFT_561918 [Bimuria novae-zelandiae CBS 107.79]|uniref:Uncharacterized protein n=1 Tax=Bimuria novae-zelandiae CBS 107.79 TaxID=1447943 RepID=A0A6A5UHY6_9PLEO|nr:hypothetical protein BU23DRAFT_561918 [Bimuria novae-zelandiae CBS 107.79]
MPYCTVCSAHFTGRGSYCTHHNPYVQTYYNTSDSNGIRYRTGSNLALTKHHHPHRSRKPFAIGFRDSHDALERYRPHTSSNALALTGYHSPISHHYLDEDYDNYSHSHGYNRRTDPLLSASNLKPLGYAFERLSAAHAITQLTYAIDIHGTRSVTATANPEREQCTSCGIFVPDRMRLLGHYADFPVQCEAHGVCLRWEDVLVHADEEMHERCFVRGCRSVYRAEGGWKGSVVEGHVRGMHA